VDDRQRRRYRNGAIRLAILIVLVDVLVTVAMGWKAALWLDATALGLMIFAMVVDPPVSRS
jgi:hypothetical protein